jgi:hypothetical protein
MARRNRLYWVAGAVLLTLGLGSLPAMARSVNRWYVPTISGSSIAYGADVDLSCGGNSCEHHLSLERDGGLGWVTVESSIRPNGNGLQTVQCDRPGSTDSYKSHFHTTTHGMTQVGAGSVTLPAPYIQETKADSGANRFDCPVPSSDPCPYFYQVPEQGPLLAAIWQDCEPGRS